MESPSQQNKTDELEEPKEDTNEVEEQQKKKKRRIISYLIGFAIAIATFVYNLIKSWIPLPMKNNRSVRDEKDSEFLNKVSYKIRKKLKHYQIIFLFFNDY